MLTNHRFRRDDSRMSRRSARDSDAATHLSVVEAWLETQTSLNTRAAYRADLETFGRWCASHGSMPLRADAATLVRFQAARQAAGDSASTVRRRWSALSSFYQFALENDVTPTNPALAAARPKVLTGDPSPTPLLSSQAVDAYRALAAALDPRLEALVALLVFDGLKLGEALALDIEDVTGRPPRMSLTIRRHGVAKQIALDPDSARAVYRCAGRRLGGPLFTSARPSSQDQPRRLTRFG